MSNITRITMLAVYSVFMVTTVNSQQKNTSLQVQLKLPAGFTAMTVVEELGKNRHIAVNSNGDVFVKLSELKDGKGILMLRDVNGDGKADTIRGFGHFKGTGIDVRNGYVYASSDDAIFRYKLDSRQDVINGDIPEKIVGGLTIAGQHTAKPFTFDKDGNIYVTIGAPSNSCQETDRQKASPGLDPCPLLETAGGIWRFRGDVLKQTMSQGERYATGIRNAMALDWDPLTNQLYALQHGRDDLHRLFPASFTNQQNTDLPAEEMILVRRGSNFGWPYCYFDHFQGKRVTMPEYGGDGNQSGRCTGIDNPLIGFPAHWAPNDMIFYTGNMFPARYRNGVFIAFHGSWNRAPQQQGFYVVFVPMKDGRPSAPYEIFASGFEGAAVKTSGEATHRPCGLAQGPDGALYISDSQKGTIWKISYR